MYSVIITCAFERLNLHAKLRVVCIFICKRINNQLKVLNTFAVKKIILLILFIFVMVLFFSFKKTGSLHDMFLNMLINVYYS